MAKKNEKIIVRNAKLDYLNFAGKANNYNAEGNRNFCIIFDDLDLVQKMIDDHWNMKPYKPSIDEDTGEATEYYTQVNVAYGSEWYDDPVIKFVTDGGRKQTEIFEESVSEIDRLDFSRIDVVIRLNRSINKKTKLPQTKGYLQRLYAWLDEDELQMEYDNMMYGDAEPTEDLPFDED